VGERQGKTPLLPGKGFERRCLDVKSHKAKHSKGVRACAASQSSV